MSELSKSGYLTATETTPIRSAAQEIVMADRLIDQAINYFGDADKAAIKLFSQYIKGSESSREALVSALSLRVCMLTIQLRAKHGISNGGDINA